MFLIIKNKAIFSRIVFLVVLSFWCVIVGLGQNTIKNKVYGKVFDQQDAVIPGTILTMKNLENGKEQRAFANEYGKFEFINIEHGKYKILAKTEDFDISGKEIEVGQNSNIEVNFNLKVHEWDETILRLDKSKKSTVQQCQLHKLKLQFDTVSIEYGLVVFDYDSMVKMFPNSNSVYYGGCVVDCYQTAEVLFCSKCRWVEKKWLKQRSSN